MKKVLLSAVLLLALVSLVSIPADSKPMSCGQELQSCIDRCQSSYGGVPFVNEGCIAGCNVGYLFC